MKLAVLFSGGKDSAAALVKARRAGHDVVCLLSMRSENPDSYMFHTPNARWTELQAKAAGLPLVIESTKGEKEAELEDLRRLIVRAKREYKVDGIATGAVASTYQAERIEKLCLEEGLTTFNPLWKIDHDAYAAWLVAEGFELFIVGVAAEPFTKEWLGRPYDDEAIKELQTLREKTGVSLTGEGGEFETFTAWAPGWTRRIIVEDASATFKDFAGVWRIEKARLDERPNL